MAHGRSHEKADERFGNGQAIMNPADVFQRVDNAMRLRYRIGLDAMEITDTPGYWQDKQPRLHPGHPLHGCLGCSGPFKATYSYFDTGRERGKFVSPTKSWLKIRETLRTPS